MNFYGHNAIACERDARPAFVLGSMLPDFTGMCGARLARVEHPEVQRGIELHHATDRAFHGAPTFVKLCSEGTAILSDEGLRRGSARAVAHVGVELLLDGMLSRRVDLLDAFHRALDVAASAAVCDALVWSQTSGTTRWQYFLQRLQEAPVPEGYRDPDFVADRVRNALSRRPRLALNERDASVVRQWTCDNHPNVMRYCDALLAETLERLGGAPLGAADARVAG